MKRLRSDSADKRATAINDNKEDEDGEVEESPLDAIQSQIISALTTAEHHALVEKPLAFALKEPLIEGMLLEFGVFSGKTINMMAAAHPHQQVHGFDTFTGLPEDWRPGFPKGTVRSLHDCYLIAPQWQKFSTAGKLPQVLDNVALHVGLFEDTLVPFLDEHAGTVALVHLDADLYSATRYVLRTLALASRLVDGTVLVFDELINYKGWRQGEFKALAEVLLEFRYEWQWLAQSAVLELEPVLDIATAQQVALRLLLPHTRTT